MQDFLKLTIEGQPMAIRWPQGILSIKRVVDDVGNEFISITTTSGEAYTVTQADATIITEDQLRQALGLPPIA